jgi:hypothetical protein
VYANTLSLCPQTISTITLAIILSRLFQSTDSDFYCFLGIDYDYDYGLKTNDGKSCIVGITVASLSSLLCILFLGVDILGRDGRLTPSCVTTLGIVDCLLAAITSLFWLSETIYASYEFAATSNSYDSYESRYSGASSPKTYVEAAAAIFCAFCVLSALVWVSSRLRTQFRRSILLLGYYSDGSSDPCKFC